MKTLQESLLDDVDILAKISDDTARKDNIEQFLKDHYKIIGKYTITKDWVVNVNGSIILTRSEELTNLTNGEFIFGKIVRNFDCSYSYSLESLEGGPEEVRGNFKCVLCSNLKTLEGGPKIVKKNYICSNNRALISLEGAPEKVGGDFDCSQCDILTSFKGCPKEIGGSFFGSGVKLKELTDLPERIERIFYIQLPEYTKVSADKFNIKHCGYIEISTYYNSPGPIIPQEAKKKMRSVTTGYVLFN